MESRLYIKSDLSQQQLQDGNMLDFRSLTPSVIVDEERRMKREMIPDIKKCVKINKIGRFWSIEPLGTNKCQRLSKLLSILTDQRMRQIIVPIISVTSRISLRALDWLVINYSKKHKIALINKQTHLLSVYDDYRAWLSYWKRPLYDAFRRGSRIYFEQDGFYYSTTVAQLNFLYWCEQNGILDYANLHLHEIESDMNARINECKREKELMAQTGKKRKRCDLSKAPVIKCLIYNVPVTIHF
jgi:hypothetical protein